MEEFLKPSNPELFHAKIAEEIVEMCKADQHMRQMNRESDEVWDKGIDQRNTERMKKIVADIGWPTESKVGKEAAVGAWLLVQHADHDVDFQARCLGLMQAAIPGEVRPQDIALLEDRVRVNRGQSQIYGTQFRQIEGKHVPLKIEEGDRVDERRLAMGLDTLAENIERMNRKYPL